MDCVVLAGGRPGRQDPLYACTLGRPKALLDIDGRSMLERVVGALHGARAVDEVIVVGLGEDAGQLFSRPVQHLPDQGSLVANAVAGLARARQSRPRPEPVMLCGADIPALTAAVVDGVVELCRPFDAAITYTMVTRQCLEGSFPSSGRTYVRLADGWHAGGDISFVHPDVADARPDLWERLAAGRKQGARLAILAGPGALMRFWLGRLSIEEIARRAGRAIGRPVRIVVSPFPEMAMDVDSPQQADLMRRYLSRSTESSDEPAALLH
jgi:molybdopterin-guanine dinucleotide biosynthesis protein A